MASSNSTTLFATSLISSKVQSTLPPGFTFRPLQRTDYTAGHLDVLGDLAWIGSITEEQWTAQFDLMSKCNGTYYVLVLVDGNGEEAKIVGTGALIVERKFLCELGTQGHIEDIAIKAEYQGKRFGFKLIEALDHIASQVGCYKTVLDTSQGKTAFYEKNGYENSGCAMHHYFDQKAKDHNV